jgi:hypothetical protein
MNDHGLELGFRCVRIRVIAVVSLFMFYNGISNTSGCVAFADRVIVNNELKGILMEVVVASFEILLRPFSE